MAEPVSGFMAISPNPTGPLARRKVVRGPDGTPSVVFIDNNTGQELPSLSGYTVVEGSNYMDLDTLGLNPTATEPPKETEAQKIVKKVSSRGDDEPDIAGQGGTGVARNPSNNFGYINKPAWSSAPNALPGPLGLASRAANAAVNYNNATAIDSARGMMGVPELGFGGTAKQTFKDQKGQVADVQLNNNTYSVGLEAMTPDGRTNLTPDEARKRGLALGGITLSTDEQSKANRAKYYDEQGKPAGIFGRISSSIGSFIDNMFGSSKETQRYQYDPVATSRIESNNTGASFNPSDSGFSDMLSGKTGTSGLAGKAADYSKNNDRDRQGGSGRDLSPAASDAIDRGEGGLY